MNTAKELAKLTAVQGMDMFLRNFFKVPDDKLNWSPTATSKSALRIAAHVAVTNGNFADFMLTGKLPTADDVDEFVARTTAAEVAITNKEEMERVFRENTQRVLDAIDTLTDEQVEIVFESGMSMKFLMRLAGWHATLHLGQIDYLQTCWDDQEIYVG